MRLLPLLALVTAFAALGLEPLPPYAKLVRWSHTRVPKETILSCQPKQCTVTRSRGGQELKTAKVGKEHASDIVGKFLAVAAAGADAAKVKETATGDVTLSWEVRGGGGTSSGGIPSSPARKEKLLPRSLINAALDLELSLSRVLEGH